MFGTAVTLFVYLKILLQFPPLRTEILCESRTDYFLFQKRFLQNAAMLQILLEVIMVLFANTVNRYFWAVTLPYR